MSIALICARGGSKGLPGKNILKLSGKPLIAYSIELALASQLIDRVIVSTDCEKIAEVARDCGAEVPFLRPYNLSTDKSPEWLVWRHAVNHLHSKGDKCETLVVLPPTGPLRNLSDVNTAIHLFKKEQCDIVLTVKPSDRNPLFNMVKIADDGAVSLAMPPETPFHRRQDANPFFDITTNCYVVRADYVVEQDNIFAGNVKAVTVAEETAVDIDTALDFEWAEFLINRMELDYDKT